jgi:hypothetical protein
VIDVRTRRGLLVDSQHSAASIIKTGLPHFSLPLAFFFVTLLQNEQAVKAVHCSLHDLPGPLRNANPTSALASRAIPGRSSGKLRDSFIRRHFRTEAQEIARQESAEAARFLCPPNHGLPKLSESSVTI